MSFCLAGPWQSVLPPPSPLDIRSPEKDDFWLFTWCYNLQYTIWFWLQCRNITEKKLGCLVIIFGDASRILKCDNFQVVVTLVLWILWYLHKTEFLPKFTLFWFMKSDVGALGVGLNVSASELNLPLSEPKLLKMFGAGLNSFGGRLNLFGAKLKSRGGELNSLGQKFEFHIFLIYPNILPQGSSFSDILPQGRFCIFFLHTWRGGHWRERLGIKIPATSKISHFIKHLILDIHFYCFVIFIMILSLTWMVGRCYIHALVDDFHLYHSSLL